MRLCRSLWGDRAACSESELRQVLDGAAFLLDAKRALGAVVLEDDRPRAYGISTFCSETFVDAFLADPHPQVGKRLLIGAPDSTTPAVLQLHQIATRNAGDGLQVVVASTGFDPEAVDPDTVLGLVIASFQQLNRGYRIARIVNEVFGEPSVSIIEQSRSYEIVRRFDIPVPGGTLRSLLGTLTREQAAAWKNPLLAMFAYSLPQLFFTPPEQQVLTEAMTGVTDETISARLGVPLSTVKARWNRIQDRAIRLAPDLFSDVPMPRPGSRGVQTRHRVLQYVRDNPSELTPYTPRRGRLSSDRESPA
jgi:hypothetical protein